MKFRANVDNVPAFFHLAQAISQLQKRAIFKFTEDAMHIICAPSHGGGGATSLGGDAGLQVWSQVKVSSLFAEYRIQSNANNEISLVLATDALAGALRSAAGGAAGGSGGAASAARTGVHSFTGPEVTMRLAKKHDAAVLSFELTTQTRMGRAVTVSHDVRIEVLKPADVGRLTEPLCPEPDVHIILPPLSKLRTIAERMRPLSDVIAFRANGRGKLQLAVRTESVSLETQWTGCANPKMAASSQSLSQSQAQTQGDGENEPPRDPEELATVHISIRGFLKFLSAHLVGGTTIACICEHHCVILYVYIGDMADAGGVLTFYIPAVIDD